MGICCLSFFGQLATIANIIIHFLCMGFFHVHYMTATIISWFLANVFAFITNKLWVFHSKSTSRFAYWREFLRFMLFRLFALAIDISCMYLLREWIQLGNGLAKVLTQILVGVANYLFSKFLVFRHVS
ncbi:GtrA family protein [Tetragenococcus halophilus]|uniref:GtrA family protein n=1 Tax=Tetragenococcus halophilus TaxID=51669 RepID=UPI0009F3ED27|nr:GtrA family protein [Tetragenococcus halophilus]MCO8284118.1 GtrA family protein [Tetragenococcus halophilus]GBD60509.1 putative teichoic acid glycosylation protein [Tetragenococcus halophilus subsp. halophilus]GBD66995.1 putative teichoic acid glycosylation protein [Tetragenococcus halophilus subsp. halophilus]GBD77065.1 putative teichoic acid glycosylation protein [Tetragenococcus halophilus subsp. halophilus]GFK24498.1 cell wall teichoic acid glycosylation protein [Tetragenococcus haloph